jgi:hypothetical protein
MSQITSFNTSGILPPGSVVEQIQGNSGGPISPNSSDIIYIVGDGVTANVVGNPATHALTISVIGETQEFITDSGSATPLGGIININGGKGITTSASSNNITIASTGLYFTYVDVTMSPYTVLFDDVYLSVDTSGGPVTILFPDAAYTGEPYIVKDRTGNASTNHITITTVSGTDTFDGVTSFVMDTAYQSISFVGNGTSYEIY